MSPDGFVRVCLRGPFLTIPQDTSSNANRARQREDARGEYQVSSIVGGVRTIAADTPRTPTAWKAVPADSSTGPWQPATYKCIAGAVLARFDPKSDAAQRQLVGWMKNITGGPATGQKAAWVGARDAIPQGLRDAGLAGGLDAWDVAILDGANHVTQTRFILEAHVDVVLQAAEDFFRDKQWTLKAPGGATATAATAAAAATAVVQEASAALTDEDITAILNALTTAHDASLSLESCVKDHSGKSRKGVAKKLRKLMSTLFSSLGWGKSTLVDEDSMSNEELHESIAAAHTAALADVKAEPGSAHHRVVAGWVHRAPRVASNACSCTRTRPDAFFFDALCHAHCQLSWPRTRARSAAACHKLSADSGLLIRDPQRAAPGRCPQQGPRAIAHGPAGF